MAKIVIQNEGSAPPSEGLGKTVIYTKDDGIYLVLGDGSSLGPVGPNTGAAGGDLSGTYPDPTIAAGAVTSGKIAAGAVGAAQLADSSVTTIKIVDGNVTLPKLNLAVQNLLPTANQKAALAGTSSPSGTNRYAVVVGTPDTDNLLAWNGSAWVPKDGAGLPKVESLYGFFSETPEDPEEPEVPVLEPAGPPPEPLASGYYKATDSAVCLGPAFEEPEEPEPEQEPTPVVWGASVLLSPRQSEDFNQLQLQRGQEALIFGHQDPDTGYGWAIKGDLGRETSIFFELRTDQEPFRAGAFFVPLVRQWVHLYFEVKLIYSSFEIYFYVNGNLAYVANSEFFFYGQYIPNTEGFATVGCNSNGESPFTNGQIASVAFYSGTERLGNAVLAQMFSDAVAAGDIPAELTGGKAWQYRWSVKDGNPSGAPDSTWNDEVADEPLAYQGETAISRTTDKYPMWQFLAAFYR